MRGVRVVGRYLIELSVGGDVLIADLEDLLHQERLDDLLDHYRLFGQVEVEECRRLVWPSGAELLLERVRAIAKPARPARRVLDVDDDMALDFELEPSPTPVPEMGARGHAQSGAR